MKLTADIFIPTANNLAPLKHCLASLKAQTFHDFRVILVGIRPNQNIEHLIKLFPSLSIVYLVQRSPGLVQAANEALDQSTADIFIRIDDDVVTSPGWLREIVRIFMTDRYAGGVTGPTVMSDRGRTSRDLFAFFERQSSGMKYIGILFGNIYKNYIYERSLTDIGRFLRSGAFTLGSNFLPSTRLKKPITVDNLEACNMAMRTEVIKKLGGFDMTFNKGLGEYHEADIAYRIKYAGYHLVFSSQAAVEHRVETSKTSPSRPDARHRISNFIIFYRRHLFQWNIDRILRFATNIVAQNMYYCYKCVTTGDLHQLEAIFGTMYGLFIK